MPTRTLKPHTEDTAGHLIVSARRAESASVLNVRFDCLSTDEVADQVIAWAESQESRYVCFSNAHGVIEAQEDPSFADVLNEADLNAPDGMSVVREMRARGVDQSDRVYGPDLTLEVVRRAAEAEIPVAFYGSTPEVLASLVRHLRESVPTLEIVDAISPPFRALSREEDHELTERLQRSGARIVFVGLGCPRQEWWCAQHVGRLDAVLLAVGAAFDIHAGIVPQAPSWMQRAGLEWAFRLGMEPKRLWRRYARVIPRFLIGVIRERRTA